MEIINVKIDESSSLKAKKESINVDILKDQMNIETRQEKGEEEEEKKQDEKQAEEEQGKNQNRIV